MAAALVALGTLLLILVNIAYWARETLLDSDEFSGTVSDVLRRDEATDRIGNVLAQQALNSGQVQDRIVAALPDNADFLPVLLEDQLQEVLARTISRLLSLDGTQDLIEAAVLRLHERVISTLEGREDGLSAEDGALVINLQGAVSDFMTRIGVSPEALEERQVGRVVLVEDADSLDTASSLVRSLNTSVPLLFLGSVLTFAASVPLLVPRSSGVRRVGYGIVIAAVLSLLIWRLGMLASSAFLDERPVASMMIESLAANLRLQSFLLLAIGGALVATSDVRFRGWLARQASSTRARIDAFGASKTLLIGAVVVTFLLIVV